MSRISLPKRSWTVFCFVKQFRDSVSYFTESLIDISHLSGKYVKLSLLKIAD